MAEQSVTLQPNESKLVSFEAIPHEARTYQVSVNGLTGSFRAIAVARFHVPPEMTKKIRNGTILGMYWIHECWCDITNKGSAPGTHRIHLWDSIGELDYYFNLTLQPGETYRWSHKQWLSWRGNYSVYLEGDWEENNYSEAIFY